MNTTCKLLIWLILFSVNSALADTAANIPEPLKPWSDWVLRDQPQWQCPFFQDDYQQKRCAWPGTLKLDLNSNGGQFNVQWTLAREEWIFLPGDTDHWPQNVKINNRAATVIKHDIRPALRLAPGQYQITGRFIWNSLPEQLALPPSTGLLTLTLNGTSVINPALKQGSLWLNNHAALQNSERDSDLDIQVFRKIVDEVPLQIETRIQLQVAGNIRELKLPHAVLQGFIPITMDSDLPVRVERDQQLTAQVRPGTWEISVLSYYPQALEQLSLDFTDEQWPASELWSFEARPELRAVELDLPAIDASQTNAPEDWRTLPTYALQQGQALNLRVVARGDDRNRPNQLTLTRRLWLDFDGGGYTVQDVLNGSLSSGWRINALPPLSLGQVNLNGQNQLITETADHQQGVEVRNGNLNLIADSRIERSLSELNVVGWAQTVQHVSTELNLPPGWRLLAVFGVDNQPAAWLSSWSLMDFFLVLLIATAIARLWSPFLGVASAVALILIWQEADVPQWTWLATLAGLALLKVLPDASIKVWITLYRNICWLILIALVLPFMVNQARLGLYPQLEHTWIQPPILPAAAPASYAEAGLALAEPKVAQEELASSSTADRSFKRSAKSIDIAQNINRIDPDAQTQTGPGLPQWRWQQVHLEWNGSINPQQTVRLCYLPPWANRILHFIQAAVAGGLTLLLLGVMPALRMGGRTLFGLLLASSMTLAPFDPAQAQIPDAALLEQLKQHLLTEPACLPDCAQLARMSIKGQSDRLSIELEVHAQQNLAIPLPVAAEQWLPEQIAVDGKPHSGIVRDEEGTIWLWIAAGTHQVSMQGRTLPLSKFSLPLPLSPHFVEANVSGWQIDGLYENGKVGEQLEFNRAQFADDRNAIQQQGAFPAFVLVERTIHLGLDWSVSTRVSQIQGSDAPVSFELPLLAGEAVTTSQIRVQNGNVQVNLASGDSEQQWESRLERSDVLQLHAENRPWFEIWRADISPIWHVETTGIAPILQQHAEGSWLPEWRPWPGEALQLNISRPQAVAGATLTIDRSDLTITVGKRGESAQLQLSIRSSKGGQHSIKLPADAELQSVNIDGTNQPLQLKQRQLNLPIHPGAQQVNIQWQTARDQSTLFRSPEIDLGLANINTQIHVSMGDDRWILWALGPQMGPAVLFWGWLLVLAGLAFALGKTGYSPLRSWHWALLLLGLSQVSVLEGLIVVGWLLALEGRQRRQPDVRWQFNLMQIGLALLSISALLLLFSSVEHGLLGTPDMQIVGNDSTAAQLNWLQDRSDALLPQVTVVNVPILLYRLLMLLWSLWMAFSLIDWLRWGWSCFASNGLWRDKSA